MWKEDSSEESDEDFMSRRMKRAKLGDRLFAEDAPRATTSTSNESQSTPGNKALSSIQEVLKELKGSKAQSALIAKENPELMGLVEEYHYSV